MRIVGLDVGERRVGIAMSDMTATLASPVGVLRTASVDAALDMVTAEVARLGAEEGVRRIVVGLPRRLDGSPNDMTARIQRFGADLETRLGIPVSFQDERLTSREAESRLAERERSWRARKQRLDAAAAAIILQDYLDANPLPAASAQPS